MLPKLIPAGYEILDSLAGDLNGDAKLDLLVILKVNGEDTMVVGTDAPRPLLIFIRQADGSLKQEGRNDEAVLCKWCGGVWGDPYSAMVISGNYFSVEHYAGSTDRWTDIVTFWYNKEKKTWFLHKIGGEVFNAFEAKTTSSWLKTTKDFGVVEFRNFNRDIAH
jgi:hypothetical protein